MDQKRKGPGISVKELIEKKIKEADFFSWEVSFKRNEVRAEQNSTIHDQLIALERLINTKFEF